jgi:hypothetical protein
MEIFLHLWDELDDLAGAARHVAAAAVAEVAELSRPVMSAASSVGSWLIAVASLKGP